MEGASDGYVFDETDLAVILGKTFDLLLSVAFPHFAGRNRKPSIWPKFTVNRTRVFPLL